MWLKFYISLDVLLDPFCFFTPFGEFIVSKRVNTNSPVSLSARVTQIYLVEINMLDFDVFLGMDYLHYFNATIDFRT